MPGPNHETFTTSEPSASRAVPMQHGCAFCLFETPHRMLSVTCVDVFSPGGSPTHPRMNLLSVWSSTSWFSLESFD